jgi:ubiquinone/menaquinone biosynthesis C-methylase UbiE
MSASIAPTSAPPSSSSSAPSTFSIRVNESEREVVFSGILRPFMAEHMAAVRAYLEKAARNAVVNGPGVLHLNFKRLKHMNNVAFLEINKFVKWSAQRYPNLKICFIISSVVPWALSKFQVFDELYDTVTLETYDKTLYPFQQVAEDNDFIEVLRTQERIIWEHEEKVLVQHGLRPGMRIADICCGAGDFAILLQKDFKPSYLVGVDHSRPSLRYAQQTVTNFGLESIEYQYGDASALLLPDNSFDFVACRLALQVFHQPDVILHELYRICKPGGRIYVTNEALSCVVGYPNQESILAGYQRYVELGRMVGVDVDIGVKTRHILVDADLEDVKVNLIDVNNMNTDCEEFARVVDSWIRVAARMATAAQADPIIHKTIEDGFRDHIQAIMSDRGYATWPIYAGSGRKPFPSPVSMRGGELWSRSASP